MKILIILTLILGINAQHNCYRPYYQLFKYNSTEVKNFFLKTLGKDRYHFVPDNSRCIMIMEGSSLFVDTCTLPNECGKPLMISIKTSAFYKSSVKLCIGYGLKDNGWYDSYRLTVHWQRQGEYFLDKELDKCAKSWLWDYRLLHNPLTDDYKLLHVNLTKYMFRYDTVEEKMYKPPLNSNEQGFCFKIMPYRIKYTPLGTTYQQLISQIPIQIRTSMCDALETPITPANATIMYMNGVANTDEYCPQVLRIDPLDQLICKSVEHTVFGLKQELIFLIDHVIQAIISALIKVISTIYNFTLLELEYLNNRYKLLEYTVVVVALYLYSKRLMWSITFITTLSMFFGVERHV